MSQLTYQQARGELEDRITAAIKEKDAPTLYILANSYAKQGDDETAHYLLTKARLCLM